MVFTFNTTKQNIAFGLRPAIIVCLLGASMFSQAQQTRVTDAPPEAGVPTSTTSLPLPAFSLTINGNAVPEQVYKLLLEEKSQGKEETVAMRQQVKDELITQYLLAAEARKEGLDKEQELRLMMEQIENRQLGQAYFARFMQKHTVKEEDLRQNYERIVQELGNQQYKIRQMVLPDEAKAHAVLEELKNGAPFAAVALRNVAPGLPKGGDIGWINLSHLAKILRNKVEPLKPGQYTTDPVKTEHGWHLVAVEDIRSFSPPEFEKVRGNLELKAQQDAFERHIKALRAKASIQ